MAGDRTLGLVLMYFITGATIFSSFAFLGAPGWAYKKGAAAEKKSKESSAESKSDSKSESKSEGKSDSGTKTPPKKDSGSKSDS